MSEPPLCPNPEPHIAHVWFESDGYHTCIGRESSLAEDLADVIHEVLDQHGEETDYDGTRIWNRCYCGAKVDHYLEEHIAQSVAQAVLAFFRRSPSPLGERPPGTDGRPLV